MLKKKLYVASPIIWHDWQALLEKLTQQGYNPKEIVKMIGFSPRTVSRWFNNPSHLPAWRLFSNILCLYCYLNYKKALYD